MQQLSLFEKTEGCPPLPPPELERDVIFYALLLGAQLFSPLARLVTAQRELHGLTGRMRPSDTFHISVLGFGFADSLDAADIALAQAVASEVRFEPFDLRFTDLMSFGDKRKSAEPRAVVLTCGEGSTDVLGLAARLATRMIAHGFRPRAFRPQVPHLTLLYDKIRVPKSVLEPPVSVRVEGFSLVRSHRGEGRYSVLWPRPQ